MLVRLYSREVDIELENFLLVMLRVLDSLYQIREDRIFERTYSAVVNNTDIAGEMDLYGNQYFVWHDGFNPPNAGRYHARSCLKHIIEFWNMTRKGDVYTGYILSVQERIDTILQKLLKLECELFRLSEKQVISKYENLLGFYFPC